MDRAGKSQSKRRQIDWIVAWALIILISILHYSTMTTKLEYHTLYRDLYFVPILLMSYRYGLKKGMYTAIIVVLIYLPHVFMTWSGQPGVNFGNLLQTLVFLIVAATMGFLSDLEKARQEQIIESKNWAALGRASLAMSYELDDIRKSLRNLLSSVPEEGGIQSGLRDVIGRLATLEESSSRFAPDRSAQPHAVIEVNESVLKARNELADRAKAKGIDLQVDLKPAGCFVRMREEDLLWVITELTANAVEHTRPGGVVTISSEHDGGRCTLKVKDQGEGISPENLQKVFVPFFTTKEKGSGLGLAVCQKVLRDEGGAIEAESTPGEGSCFTLVLPLAHTQTEE